MTSPEEKKHLLKEYFDNKRSEKCSDKKMYRLGDDSIDSHSTLFSATFCEGAVEAVVMADQGAYDNLMPPQLLEAMIKANSQLQVTELCPPLVYDLATVVADVDLRIRHGTTLKMRGMEWVVSDQEAQHALISRRVLEACGINNIVLLQAACDRHDGILNVPDILQGDQEGSTADDEHAPAGSIASLVRDSGVYHSYGGAEEDRLEEADVYIDVDNASTEDLDKALADRVAEARANPF